MRWSVLDKLLWAAGLVEHSVLFFVLVRWSRWRTFPVLTALAGYEVCVSVWLSLLSRFGMSHAYFIAYWIAALVDYLFQLALMVELARMVFPKGASWIYGWRSQLVICSLLGAFIAGSLCIPLSPTGVTGLDLWDERITLFTSLLVCEVYIAITSTANRLRLRWRDHVASLGNGLALWSAAAVVGDVAHAINGWKASFALFDQARMVTYLGVLIYWIHAFQQPERDSSYPTQSTEMILERFYEHALQIKKDPGQRQ